MFPNYSYFWSTSLLAIQCGYIVLVGRAIDAVSREPLWEVGVDYMHETGHGISHNGAVVEGILLL